MPNTLTATPAAQRHATDRDEAPQPLILPGQRLIRHTKLARVLDISTKTLQRQVKSGEAPAPVKPASTGREAFYSVNQVMAWLDAGQPHTDDWEAPPPA